MNLKRIQIFALEGCWQIVTRLRLKILDLVVGRTIRALQSGNGELSMEHVRNVRSCFAQFVRLLRTKSLITDDDVINYINVCPLFKATYVFYDENKSFYQSLNEVQAKILNDDDVGKDMNTNGRKRWMTMIVGLSLMGVGFFSWVNIPCINYNVTLEGA